MSAYLFVGGPIDQQWREVPRGRQAFVIAVEDGTGVVTAGMVLYYRSTIFTAGWLVPITVYAIDPLRLPDGAPMPGWVQGATLERWPITMPFVPFPADDARALHAAIKRRGFRP